MVKNMSGIVFNGLYLVQKEPNKGDKGLLVNGKYFIPVTNEPSGAVASYYKCTAVSSGASQPEGYILTIDFYDSSVPGDPLHYKNTLTMVDPSATGLDRVWKSADGTWELKKYDMSQYEGYISWQLYMSSEGTTYVVYIGDIGPNTITGDNGVIIDNNEPWTITRWYDTYGGYTDTITWTASPAVSGASTWSGYKAVFDSTAGTWSFEDTVTEGLSYTSVTPTVGNIYSEDALVIVSSLWNGIPGENLVFYLPLNKTTIADIGPELSASGTIVNTTMDSIPCAYFNGNSRLYASSISIPTGASPRALSLWLRYKDIPGTTASDASVFAGWGTTSSMARFEAYVEAQELYIIYSSNYLKTDIKIQDANWHHVLLQYDGSTSEIYYDGQLAASEAKTLGTRNNYLYVGARENGEYAFDGYLAGIRIYNRAMTGTEIAYLASEFTPTT